MYIFHTYLDIDNFDEKSAPCKIYNKLKMMRITILVKYINFPLPFPSSLNDCLKNYLRLNTGYNKYIHLLLIFDSVKTFVIKNINFISHFHFLNNCRSLFVAKYWL